MINLIYCIVIFISTTLGALVGLGGGVIIKPVLDFISADTVETVSFISACAVFAMSISAALKHFKGETKFDKKIVLLVSLGAVFGGFLGNIVFDATFKAFDNNTVKGIQGIILGIVLLCVNIYINGKFKSFHLKNPFAIISIGLLLGTTASFLGVGGGPINVAFLVMFFSFTVKEAAFYSVATIFFSQLSKLTTIFFANGFQPFDLKILIFIIPCAVIGGIIGVYFNKKCGEKTVKKIFTISVYAIIALNFYNAFTALI